MCLRVGMAYRGSSVCTILLKPSYSTTLYGRRSLHMKTATDSVIFYVRTEPGASLHRRDLSSCVCFESDLAMGCCRTSAWCRLRWFRRFVVLLQYFRTAWQSLHNTWLLSISCVPGLHRNTKWIHTSAFRFEGAGLKLLLLTLVAISLWFGLVRSPCIQRESHEDVAHSAPTGQGLESIQKFAELILNCREKNCDALLNRYFYPPLICMFYHTIESALFYAVVNWGSCTTDKNCRRLDKLVKKASSVVGRRLDPLSAVVEQQMRRKLYFVLENYEHPLHSILAGQRSSCSERLISLRCRTERFRRSFVPTAIRLFNSDCWHVLLKFIYFVIDYYYHYYCCCRLVWNHCKYL